ncbi:MAG: AfsR/SARP family transcriptional regulator [Acidimicrobiales bacterium]
MWGESLPADPAAALQSHLSRLRSTLGPVAAGIETVSGGYRLRSDVITVDVSRFETLLGLAGDGVRPARERARLLGQAVALVRGAAFEDLEVDDAYMEARRISDLVTGARLGPPRPTPRPAPRRSCPPGGCRRRWWTSSVAGGTSMPWPRCSPPTGS